MKTQRTNATARIRLPKAFANTVVMIEQVSDTELRIRKSSAVPQDGIRFYEETAIRLSDLDRDRFLELLDNPPEPNEALVRAIDGRKKRNG